MSNHNTVIYNSSTFKQCLQVLTFPHSSSCNANRAPFSKLVKREQILVVCHLHGFLNQQMVQQNRQFPHLLCPCSCTMCLRNVYKGLSLLTRLVRRSVCNPFHIFQNQSKYGSFTQLIQEARFQDKVRKKLLNLAACCETKLTFSCVTSEILPVFPSVLGMMLVILLCKTSGVPYRPDLLLTEVIGKTLQKSFKWLFIISTLDG